MVKQIVAQPNILTTYLTINSLYAISIEQLYNRMQSYFPAAIWGTPNAEKSNPNREDLYEWFVSNLYESDIIRDTEPAIVYSKVCIGKDNKPNSSSLTYSVINVIDIQKKAVLYQKGELRYNGALIQSYNQAHSKADIELAINALSNYFTIKDMPFDTIDDVADFIASTFNQNLSDMNFKGYMINYFAAHFGYDYKSWDKNWGKENKTPFYTSTLFWAKYIAFAYADYVFSIRKQWADSRFKYFNNWLQDNESRLIQELKSVPIFSAEVQAQLLNAFNHFQTQVEQPVETKAESKPKTTRTRKTK
jgi:hypothetical protein